MTFIHVLSSYLNGSIILNFNALLILYQEEKASPSKKRKVKAEPKKKVKKGWF